MIETRRRRTFHVPGEPLMVTASPMEAATRFDMMKQFTGLSSDELLVTPIVTTPLPCYPEQWPEGRRRWTNVEPAAMWHPLLWLPERVAHRYKVIVGDENEATEADAVMESDDTWAVRVCMELSAAGLYNDATGDWLDIMSAVGIDVDNDADVARIEEWLAGEPDEHLDAIDLAPLLDRADDPDWALIEASAWLPSLRVVMWATHAEYLLESVRSLTDSIAHGVTARSIEGAGLGPDDESMVPVTYERAVKSAGVIAMFAADVFSDLDENERVFWALLQRELDADPERQMAGTASGLADPTEIAPMEALEIVLDMMTDRIATLRDHFTPAVEASAVALAGGVTQFAQTDDHDLADSDLEVDPTVAEFLAESAPGAVGPG